MRQIQTYNVTYKPKVKEVFTLKADLKTKELTKDRKVFLHKISAGGFNDIK